MGYTALYRKFRPDTFADVKGQDAIVQTLKNQINADRVGHAYLFCGTRGTGKTTVAKILAKTVNCEHPVDGSPCGECASCRAIAEGSSMNVIEIDAASNNGVDNIREIREEVAYSPTEGKYKVYIIDEVHMLSAGAFNALLKTLEEPPSYVIFILATTEAHKIPITILSRCQRYDFKHISIQTIADRMMDLMQQEGVEVEERAIRYIAKKADGSMRDGLSLLDQCIAFYLGQKLTYDHVLDVLGAVDTEVFSQMLRAILSRDVASLMRQMEDLIMQGRELGQFVSDFTWYLRNLLLLKSSDDMEDVLDISSENLKILQEEAGLVRDDTLMRFIRIFSELSNQMKFESSKRLALEVALIKLCRPQMETDQLSVLERVRALEAQLEDAVLLSKEQAAGLASQPMQPVGIPVNTPVRETPAQRQEVKPVKPAPEDLQRITAQWNSIIDETSGMFRGVMAEAKLQYNAAGDDDALYVVFSDFLGERYLHDEESIQLVTQIISAKLGKEVLVKFVLAADKSAMAAQLTDISVEGVQDTLHGFPVEIDDADADLF